jgi:drug/metabolite transporter (DMT)-like permease
MSTTILCFSLAVTLQALFEGKSGMWEGVPSWTSVIIFFLLLCVVGMMEGMQIAAFALLKMPDDELSQYSVASANCKLMSLARTYKPF